MTDTNTNEILLLPNITNPDMTVINKIQFQIVKITDILVDHHIDAIPVLDIDHVHFQGTNHFNSTLLDIDLLQGLEILDHLDLDKGLK